MKVLELVKQLRVEVRGYLQAIGADPTTQQSPLLNSRIHAGMGLSALRDMVLEIKQLQQSSRTHQAVLLITRNMLAALVMVVVVPIMTPMMMVTIMMR